MRERRRTIAAWRAPLALAAGMLCGSGSVAARAQGGVWTPLGPPAVSGLSSFAVSPQGAATLYAISADGTKLYGTRDGGASWRSLPVPPTGASPDTFAFQAAADPAVSTTVYLATAAFTPGGHGAYGLYRSGDGGTTWSPLASAGSASWVAVDPRDDRILYSGPHAVRSADGGATWTAPAGLPGDVAQVIFDPSAPGNVYALASASPNVWKSVDRGLTWSVAGAAIGDLTSLCVDPASSSILYAAAGGYVEKSVDGGAIWQIVYRPADPVHHGAVAVAAAPTAPTSVYGVVAGVGVGRSTDGGQTWAAVPTATLPGAVTALQIDPLDPRRLLASVAGAGLAATFVPGPCAAAPAALCLGAPPAGGGSGRFLVAAAWQTGQAAGTGQAVALTADTGVFWFFDAADLELVVKVLDGCALNGSWWVFAGGLTDVGVALSVTDTATGRSRSYTNPNGTPFPPLQDTAAFTCP